MRKQLYTMNHIGITFPDIDAAFVWYRDVLGCFVLAEPADVLNDGSHFGNIVHNIFGDKLFRYFVVFILVGFSVNIIAAWFFN